MGKDDDGRVVYESRAICRYICRKYQPGPQLLPAEGDLRAYAMFEQAVSVEVYNFDVHVQAAARERFLKPYVLAPTSIGSCVVRMKSIGCSAWNGAKRFTRRRWSD